MLIAGRPGDPRGDPVPDDAARARHGRARRPRAGCPRAACRPPTSMRSPPSPRSRRLDGPRPAPVVEAVAPTLDARARALAWLTALGGAGLPARRCCRASTTGSGLANRARATSRCGWPGTWPRCCVGVALILLAPPAGPRQAAGLAGRRASCSRSAAVVHVLKGPHPIVVALLAGDARSRSSANRATPSRARPDPGSLLSVVRFVPAYLAARARLRRRSRCCSSSEHVRAGADASAACSRPSSAA